MARKVHELDRAAKDVAPPQLGALLRRPFVAMRGHIIGRLHEAGYADILPAHLAIFQHPGPHGRSPGDIARTSLASKQATNNLLTQLEKGGYLTRAINPDNRRERVVQLTILGFEVIHAIRAAVNDLEREWRRQLGARAYDDLRRLLDQLNQSLPSGSHTPF